VSREDVTLVREGFDAWNRGDLQWILDHTSPDWEWRPAGVFPGTDAVYRGKEGFAKFWNTFREPWENISVALERAEDLGDRVLALFTFYGKGRESGVEVTVRYANVFTVDGGIFTYQVGYADWESALEAVGLQE
jgi:ketosteroid isomerase-like protein